MPLYPAKEDDLPAVVQLVNSAYRGDSSREGWSTEADFLGGQRTDFDTLREELSANPEAELLLFREEDDTALLGCVWIAPDGNGAWYLGMLTVRPDLQDRGIGRRILGEAEAAVASRGGRCTRMTVINVREDLIAWYKRRGYAATGETKPFPYGDERFGIPLRDDLLFIVMEKPLGV